MEEYQAKGKWKFKIKVKNYNLTPQEKNDYCVCSVLQAIFRSHGLKLTQEQIALGLTPSENGFYIGDPRMKKFLGSNNFDYTYFGYNSTPFNEPDMLLNDMNMSSSHGIIGVNSHAFLLTDFKDPELKLLDPENGIILIRNLHEILEDMKKGNGLFGLVKHIQ